MPLWLYVPGEGPRKDCGREVVSRDILSRRRRIGRRGGGGGEGAFTMKRICPQRRLVGG